MQKTTYNLLIFEKVAEEFEKWHAKTAGGKGEKCSGGIMALMGLHQIDEGLAFALMDPSLTAKSAAELIQKTLKDVIYRQALEVLTPEQRARLLEEAKRSEQKVLGKKK
ncbi:MAG: hypothetical protein FVQ82_12930 [Planctomycetes bacterium]|nr:hypothetical protein [Planctomycetota bacterium]